MHGRLERQGRAPPRAGPHVASRGRRDPEAASGRFARRRVSAANASPRAGSSGGRDDRGVAVSAFGLTDVGRKRRHNEDAYLLDAERGLFVVADGMGGHAAGEVASRITVETIQEYIAATEEEHESSWPFGFNSRVSLEGNRLTTAVEKANEKVMRAVAEQARAQGHGDDSRGGSLRCRPRDARARRRQPRLPLSRRRAPAPHGRPLLGSGAGQRRHPQRGRGARAIRSRTSSHARSAARRTSRST